MKCLEDREPLRHDHATDDLRSPQLWHGWWYSLQDGEGKPVMSEQQIADTQFQLFAKFEWADMTTEQQLHDHYNAKALRVDII